MLQFFLEGGSDTIVMLVYAAVDTAEEWDQW